MKRLLFIMILILVSGCSNYAVRIGNPPIIPDAGDNNNNNNNNTNNNNNDDDGDDNGAGFSKEIFTQHPNWGGSITASGNFTTYLATFDSENVTLLSTNADEILTAEYEVSIDGTVYTVNKSDDSLIISGKVEAKDDGYEITLNLYKKSQLITTLYEIIGTGGVLPSDILDPKAACLKSEDKCFSTDNMLGMPEALYTVGQVVSDVTGGDSCNDTLTDYCAADDELIQYACMKSSKGKILEKHYECNCKDGRCLDAPEDLMDQYVVSVVEESEPKPLDKDQVLSAADAFQFYFK